MTTMTAIQVERYLMAFSGVKTRYGPTARQKEGNCQDEGRWGTKEGRKGTDRCFQHCSRGNRR